MLHRRTCKMCKGELIGRSDKKFCSIYCKTTYHRKLTADTNVATRRVDKILHRNRSILLEIMGKHHKQIKVARHFLDRQKFNFNYFTSRTVNKAGKVYLHVYDFRYMTFSDATVLIVRK